MAEAKKTAAQKAEDKEKKITKSTTAKKATTTKKSTTAKSSTTKTTAKKATTSKSTKTTKVKVEVAIDKAPKKTTKASKLEEKAQEAKMKRAIKKTAAEAAEEKAKKAAEEEAARIKAEKAAQAEIERVKKLAEAAERKAAKIASTRKKVSTMDLPSNTTKEDDERFTKVIILNFDNKKLPKELFASSKIYEQAIFDTIMSERASRRQGTHDVKSRAEVRGGGKKPWRQKGTGRARAGSTRSPIWVGGGRAFGPNPDRNYNLKVNKKVKKAAFISALTLLSNNKAVIIDDFKMTKISTKDAVKQLTKLKLNDLKHVLLVSSDETVYKSVANLQNVACVKPNSVTVELLIWADAMILSNEGLKAFEGRIK